MAIFRALSKPTRPTDFMRSGRTKDYEQQSKRRFLLYTSSLLHVLLVAFIGYLISLRETGLTAILLFAAASKLFSVIFGEDAEASKRTRICSAVPLSVSIIFLCKLSQFQLIAGISILTVYACYPLMEGKAPFDVLHHALRYALLFLLAYNTASLNDALASLALLVIALFSAAGELISGLPNKTKNRGTASLLGIRRSSIAAALLILIASLVSAYAFNIMYEFPIQVGNMSIPFYTLPALLIAYILVRPLIKAANGGRADLPYSFRKKEAMTLAIMSITVLAVLWGGATNVDTAVNSRDYSLDVEIRTIIAGKNSWDLPWILFDYRNQSNYRYLLLHKDGTLELSQVVNGQRETHIASLKTTLNPFQQHSFHITLNETAIVIALDGEYQMSAPRHQSDSTSRIKISSRTPCLWLAYIRNLNIQT